MFKLFNKEKIVSPSERIEAIKIPAEHIGKPTISLDNKIVSPEVQKEPIDIPKGFTKDLPIQKPQKEEKQILFKNDRPYKKLNDYQGMYCDNGEVFRINE